MIKTHYVPFRVLSHPVMCIGFLLTMEPIQLEITITVFIYETTDMRKWKHSSQQLKYGKNNTRPTDYEMEGVILIIPALILVPKKTRVPLSQRQTTILDFGQTVLYYCLKVWNFYLGKHDKQIVWNWNFCAKTYWLFMLLFAFGDTAVLSSVISPRQCSCVLEESW